jgi:hypothetical protein
LPPFRLRNGVLLKDGEFEHPVGLLKEVFLDRWWLSSPRVHSSFRSEVEVVE